MDISKETFLTAAGIIALCSGLVTEILKKIFPKVPAEIFAYASSVALTVTALAAYSESVGCAVHWYIWTAAVFCGLFIGNAAQTGFDKLTETADKIYQLKGKSGKE